MSAVVAVLLSYGSGQAQDGILLQAGGDLLKQDGGRFYLQNDPAPADALLDVDGAPMRDLSGQYVRGV